MFNKIKKAASGKADAPATAAATTPNSTAAPTTPALVTPSASTLAVPGGTPAAQTLAPGGSTDSTVGAGILLVRVVEARGLQLADATNTSAPYAVIEFDKAEFVAESTGDITAPKWQQRANFDVSRDAECTIALYQRQASSTAAPRMPQASLPNAAARLTNKPARAPIQHAAETIFLGAVRIRPQFLDQKPEDSWYPISKTFSGGGGAGELHVQLLFRKSGGKKAMSIDDFDLLKVIGKGSFGKVMQVRKKDTGRIYAMKIIRKANIVERAEVTHTLAERNVLAKMQSPFIVNLKFSFQSPDKLYLVLAFVNGGELFHHLQSEGCFHEERAKFYISELLIALECLHMYNIIYRDLKPENILLDYSGHIALCDFGLCKLNMTKDETTNTFCGTPEYLAPELLIGNGYTKVVDWWTLGVLLYEMLVGLPPFYSENTNEMYRKILSDPLRFPDPQTDGVSVSGGAQALLVRLLERDPQKRLGSNGAEEIKSHPFFSNIDWERLVRKQITPPFRPDVASATDTSNFSDEFTSEVPQDSFVEGAPALSKSVQDQFQGFTYVGNEGNAMYGASVQQNRGTFVQRGALG